MSEANKALVRAFFEAANRYDFNAFDDLVAEGYDDHMKGASIGRDALKAYFKGYRPVFPDLKIEIITMVAEGDLVSVHNRITGTHSGSFAGIAPTGRLVTAEAMQIYRIADGRLAEHWEVADVAGMLAQISAQ
jgi:steroid delta-isomerase-like uncharacterized protein